MSITLLKGSVGKRCVTYKEPARSLEARNKRGYCVVKYWNTESATFTAPTKLSFLHSRWISASMSALYPFRDINVHSSPSHYAFSSPSTPSAPTLVVERPSGDIRLHDGQLLGSQRVSSIAGIMGILRLKLGMTNLNFQSPGVQTQTNCDARWKKALLTYVCRQVCGCCYEGAAHGAAERAHGL